MSLKSYFPEQFDLLKGFLISATEVVRSVRIDPEMKPMFIKALGKMEEDSEFPHAFIMFSERFDEPVRYFDNLLAVLSKSREENAEALAEQNVKFETPYKPDSSLIAPAKFVKYASQLSESLPDNAGSLVFLIDPEDVTDQANYRRSVAYLAEEIKTDWLKFLVLDSRAHPLLENLEREQERIGLQTFYLSPDEIEKRINDDLKSSSALEPAERRQYKGLLAGFAFARKEHDKAAQLQRAWVEEAEKEGEPGEVANAYYNLGNTLLASGSYAEAMGAYCSACDICVDKELNSLAPFAYTNLGIALHRQGDFEQAFSSLKVARDMFKAQNQRPGEAYVVDCLAQMYALDDRREDAEKAWRYALSLYDGMTSSLFKDLRESGRQDILGKLERLGASAPPEGQPAHPAEC